MEDDAIDQMLDDDTEGEMGAAEPSDAPEADAS